MMNGRQLAEVRDVIALAEKHGTMSKIKSMLQDLLNERESLRQTAAVAEEALAVATQLLIEHGVDVRNTLEKEIRKRREKGQN